MAVTAAQYDTFKRGSKTYFTSSLFFPPSARADVFTLYGFVRVADDFVDSVPQDRQGFREFRERYSRALLGERAGDPIIDPFVELMKRKGFDPSWVEAFLDAMQADLSCRTYDTVEETLGYVYGSAEVIGLFMARILDLPEASLSSARLLGRSMQYINFIRDIAEDLRLGRRYLPLKPSALEALDEEHARADPAEFRRFMEHHLGLYRGWQLEAEQGFHYIPRRARMPIKTASDMYNWTAERIREDPFIVFRRRVKPRGTRIILRALSNLVTSAA
jgi:15-cis-phytoene synthase